MTNYDHDLLLTNVSLYLKKPSSIHRLADAQTNDVMSLIKDTNSRTYTVNTLAQSIGAGCR